MSFQQNTVLPYQPTSQNVTNTQVQVINTGAMVTQVISSLYIYFLQFSPRKGDCQQYHYHVCLSMHVTLTLFNGSGSHLHIWSLPIAQSSVQNFFFFKFFLITEARFMNNTIPNLDFK